MGIRERLSGNEAVAVAMRQINPDVVAAFPITPSTEIPQYFSTFVANGQVDTEFVAVESEHSAMCLYWCRSCWCKSNDSYFSKWFITNVGNDLYCFKFKTTNSFKSC